MTAEQVASAVGGFVPRNIPARMWCASFVAAALSHVAREPHEVAAIVDVYTRRQPGDQPEVA